MDDTMRKKLYESFDQNPDADQNRDLESALEQSAELKAEKKQVEQLRQKISTQKNASFDPFFETRVMNRITEIARGKKEDILFENMFRLFKPLAIAASIIIIGLAAYNISTGGHFSIENVFGIPDIIYQDALDSSFSYNVE